MRAVVQRVSEAAVVAGGAGCGSIGQGLLVYLGVEREDDQADVDYLADKVRHLRIFRDEGKRMNLDVAQVSGHVLVVSAFTIAGDARRGRRPAFDGAADADRAFVLYEVFCDRLAATGVRVARGSFGDDMEVRSVNAGPVCILLESRRRF